MKGSSFALPEPAVMMPKNPFGTAAFVFQKYRTQNPFFFRRNPLYGVLNLWYNGKKEILQEAFPMNFNYFLPVNIVFGCGRVSETGQLTKPYGTRVSLTLQLWRLQRTSNSTAAAKNVQSSKNYCS